MQRIALIVGVVVALAAGVWFIYAPGDAGSAVKVRLQALAEMVNRSTVDGLGPEARAAQLGAFFTEDVDVDLGQGAAPIKGLDTVIGMAERLQPRTAAFRLKFEDDLTYREISQVMGVSLGTVNRLITAALVAVRGRLMFSELAVEERLR